MQIVIAAACEFPDGPGGMPRMIWLMARGFAHLGHEVIIATTYGSWEGAQKKSFGEWTSICAIPRDAMKRDRAPNRVRTQIEFLYLLLKLLFQRKTDVVLFYGPLMLFSVVHLVIRMFRLSRTCYFNADSFPCYKGMPFLRRAKYKIMQLTEGMLSRHSSSILLVGTSFFEDHMHQIAPKTPIIRGRGVPTDIHTFASASGNRFREMYGVHWKHIVVYTGMMSTLEGTDILLKAFAALRSQRTDIGLVIVGWVVPIDAIWGKPLDYAAIAEQLGISDSVCFTGHISREHVSDALAAADVLVLPKIDHPTNRVAFPIKIAEYFASGRPVVCSRVCEIDQYAKDGEHLLFVVPEDEKELSAAISRLLDDQPLADSIGSRGKLLAEEFFDYRSWFAHVAPIVFGFESISHLPTEGKVESKINCS